MLKHVEFVTPEQEVWLQEEWKLSDDTFNLSKSSIEEN